MSDEEENKDNNKPQDFLGKFLDLSPTEYHETPSNVPAPVSFERTEPVNHIQEDYEQARANLNDMIHMGIDLFKNAADVAKSSQRPEGYEVAASLFKAVSEANEKMVNLSKTHQSVVGSTQKPESVTNNNLNIKISSKDFLKMVKDLKNGNANTEE